MISNPHPQQSKIMQIFRKIFFATMVASAVSAHAATEISYWLWDYQPTPSLQGLRGRISEAKSGHHRQNYPDGLE